MLQSVLVQTRQPWADIEAEPARPTAEQEEWLKAEGFREEPVEEGPDQDAEDGPPKVDPSPHALCFIVTGDSCPHRLYEYSES